ncbi:putative acetyltransferase [Leeuwenhoekiella blandensis MED217]|jgi:hypothetical protein|uniref:Putative acetyltransferase n=2 Tax=Flavobacteriaceae TaxID=49546 RepID=A3XGA9_LEEBM|nr:putative acetyltransferase [Leeuwenhoekiella blandensis MED217]
MLLKLAIMSKITVTRLYKEDINTFLPLVQELMEHSVAEDLLKARFAEMFEHRYQCRGIYVEGELAGVFGLWFAVRHYAGKTCEVDHVYIKPEYRNQGLGKQAFQWIYDYAREQGCETSELNAYVHNFPSHKFYMNENYVIKGYHFLKKL